MNQILTTKPVKQKKNVEIKTVISFFAISIIIFGICLITSGSYAIYTNISARKAEGSSSGEDQGGNTPQPVSTGIQIYISTVDEKIKAEIIGENEISFVTYRWDEEDETRAEIRSYSEEILIDIPEGEHTLTITAVDANNNSKTEERQVVGIVKPKINVTREDGTNNLLIEVSDEKGLKGLKIVFNGVERSMKFDEGSEETEKTIKCPLKEGENTIKVVVYNTEDVSEEYEETINN